VATNILGVSGRAMLEALVGGTTAPEVLTELARGKLRAKVPALRAALAGRFRPHHAFLVTQGLAHLDYLDDAIDTVSAEVDRSSPSAAKSSARGTPPRDRAGRGAVRSLGRGQPRRAHGNYAMTTVTLNAVDQQLHPTANRWCPDRPALQKEFQCVLKTD
jgi:hypothetical protein